jgi:hypothetical protein
MARVNGTQMSKCICVVITILLGCWLVGGWRVARLLTPA